MEKKGLAVAAHHHESDVMGADVELLFPQFIGFDSGRLDPR